MSTSSSLLVEKLPKHPLYSQIPAQDISTRKKKLVNTIFPTAEKLKTKLRERFEIEYEQKKEELKRFAELQEKAAREERDRSSTQEDNTTSQIVIDEPTPKSDITSQDIFPKVPLTTPDALSDYGIAPTLTPHPSTVAQHTVNDTPEVSSSFLTPQVNRTNKPGHLMQTKKERLVPSLMNLQYPKETVDKFMAVARANTLNNIETCGILCGKLSHGELAVTHLVILKQSGTADSCVTVDEEELFDVQDKHDLLTLGWIHTHPSQTSFLSSVDLHTQFSYQQLLPEAIAIVCAPKYNEIGVYNLTQDGLKVMSTCRENGFHFHAKHPPLFKDCEHVTANDSVSLDVIDLR